MTVNITIATYTILLYDTLGGLPSIVHYSLFLILNMKPRPTPTILQLLQSLHVITSSSRFTISNFTIISLFHSAAFSELSSLVWKLSGSTKVVEQLRHDETRWRIVVVAYFLLLASVYKWAPTLAMGVTRKPRNSRWQLDSLILILSTGTSLRSTLVAAPSSFFISHRWCHSGVKLTSAKLVSKSAALAIHDRVAKEREESGVRNEMMKRAVCC